jgi:hypothetical protein
LIASLEAELAEALKRLSFAAQPKIYLFWSKQAQQIKAQSAKNPTETASDSKANPSDSKAPAPDF